MSARVNIAVVSSGRGIVLSDGWAGWGFQNRLLHAAGHTDVLRRLAEADYSDVWPPVDGDPFGDGTLDRYRPLRAPGLPADPMSWADDGSAEGGAVIDLERRILTWYVTDEDWSFGVADRPFMVAEKSAVERVYSASRDLPQSAARWSTAMETVAQYWRGWTVVWAFDGVADLLRAAAVILPGDTLPGVLAPEPPRVEAGALSSDEMDDADNGVDFLITVDDDAGIWRHACFDRGDALAYGPALLDSNALLDPAQLTQIPAAGLHADPARRSAYLWSTAVMPAFQETWRRCWPGWDLTFGGARWEVHGDLVGEQGPFGEPC